jgi:HD-like signal output (HDOD) protein
MLLLDDERSHISDIVDILKQDAAITARLLQVANSAIFGPVSIVTTLEHAIVKMGTSLTRSIIYAFMFKDKLKFNSQKARNFFNEVWNENLQTAALSVLVAKYVNYRRADEVFIAGLLHNLGLLLLISHISYWNDEDIDQFIVNYNLGLLNDIIKKVSVMIISQWNLPNVFYDCAELWDVPAVIYDQVSTTVIINAVVTYNMIQKNQIEESYFEELKLVREFDLTKELMKHILEEKKNLIENLKNMLK